MSTLTTSKRQQKIAERERKNKEASEQSELDLRGKEKRVGSKADPDSIVDMFRDREGNLPFKYFLYSMSCPNGRRSKVTDFYLKIRGFAVDEEDAAEKAKQIMQIDDGNNIYYAVIWDWINFFPSEGQVMDVKRNYMDPKLDEIMRQADNDVHRRSNEVQKRLQAAKKENEARRAKRFEGREDVSADAPHRQTKEDNVIAAINKN